MSSKAAKNRKNSNGSKTGKHAEASDGTLQGNRGQANNGGEKLNTVVDASTSEEAEPPETSGSNRLSRSTDKKKRDEEKKGKR